MAQDTLASALAARDAAQTAPATPPTPPAPVSTPATPSDAGAAKPKGSFLNSLISGLYSGINTATIGIPDYLTNAISPSEYNATQAFQKQHPVASTIGNVVGALAPLAVGDTTGVAGLGVKGASALAKGAGLERVGGSLDRLITLAKGGEGVGKVSQAAAQSLLNSVPQAAVQGATTGDWASAGKQALGGTVLGTVAGSALGHIASKAAPNANIVENSLNKSVASAAGITTKILKGVEAKGAKLADVNIAGSSLMNNDDLLGRITKTVVDNKLYGEEAQKAYALGVSKKYQPFESAYNSAVAASEEPTGFWGSRKMSIMADPKIQDALTDVNPDEASGILAKLTGGMDKKATWANTREYLQDKALQLRNSEDDTKAATGKVADLLRQHVTDMAGDLAQEQNPELDLKALLHQYPADQAIKMGVLHEMQSIAKPVREGSNTFPKFSAGNMLTGGVVGGGIMGNSGDEGFDPLSAGAGFLGGAIGGPIISRLATNSGNAILGRTAGTLSKGVPALQKVAGAISGAAPAITAGVARAGSSLAPGIVNAAKPGQQPTPAAPAAYSFAPPETAPAATPKVNPANTSQVPAQAPAQPASLPPQFTDMINQGIERKYYEKGGAWWGKPTMDNPAFRDFYAGVMHQIAPDGKNLDPHLAASILFADERRQGIYLKALEAKEKIETNIGGSAQGWTGSGLAGKIAQSIPVGLGGNPQSYASRGALTEAIKGLGGDPKATTAAINRIMNSNIDQKTKLAKLYDIIKGNNPEALSALHQAGLQ